MNDYRINYGNGQVSGTMSKAKAIQALKDEDGYAFIQTWDMDGEWYEVRFSEKQAARIVHAAIRGRG